MPFEPGRGQGVSATGADGADSASGNSCGDSCESFLSLQSRLVGLRKLQARMEAGEELNPPSALQGIRLGPILLPGGPFEIFQSSKNEIRSALSESPVLVLSLVNGAEGCAPDPESYERNGCSAEFVPLLKGDPPHCCLHETLVQALVDRGESLRD